MSRIGKAPIKLAQGVEFKAENGVITVKGPLGVLTQDYDVKNIGFNVENGEIVVTRFNEENATKAKHGLYRALVNNMVIGVTAGYKKTLIVNGVGWKVTQNGKDLSLAVGLSHPVEVEEIEGITLEVPDNNTILVKGINKQEVGQFAAEIREYRLPEPYKGKGIKYADERIRRKEGKAGGKK